MKNLIYKQKKKKYYKIKLQKCQLNMICWMINIKIYY